MYYHQNVGFLNSIISNVWTDYFIISYLFLMILTPLWSLRKISLLRHQLSAQLFTTIIFILGVMKLVMWDHDKLNSSAIYDLHNIRLQRDNYGVCSLVTPKESGFTCKLSSRVFELPTSTEVSTSQRNLIKGEIMSIESITKYRTCDKCRKKLPTTKENFVKCPNSECPSTVKLKFAGKSVFVKFTFMSNNDEKMKLTMFAEDVSSLIDNFWEKSEDQLTRELLGLPELELTKHKNDIVSSINIATSKNSS